MELQDRLIAINDYRPFKSELLNKITGNCSRFIVKRLASELLPRYFKKHPGIELYHKARQEGRTSDAIVSLTSFPKRVGVVWLVIECLLRQTRVPKKIIVWLSQNQFPTEDSIPKSLMIYPEEIVEVRMVDGDIRSHKKYWYAVKECKNYPLVLVDDDLIYDSRMIEDLENYSSLENKVIACCWGAQMKWNEKGEPLPYSHWGKEKPLKQVTDSFFYGSGGGTYFPVGSLKGVDQAVDTIMDICPSADDIWLNAFSRYNGFNTCLVRKYISMPEWIIKKNITLNAVNNGLEQRNDLQLEKMRQYMLNSFGVDPFTKLF